MAQLFQLSLLDRYEVDDFERTLKETPRTRHLRDAATAVIEAVHGLPYMLETDLSKLVVYIGRTGAAVNHIRGRWSSRFGAFEYAPSTHALIAARTTTDRLREEKWERAAQRIINSLVQHNVLCCANALTGDNGNWPAEEDSVIYLVVRVQRGRPSSRDDKAALHAAVTELVDDEQLHHVALEVSRAILHPERAKPHEQLLPTEEDDDDAASTEVPKCKICWRRARPGNYGFCGLHRAHVADGSVECRVCGRAAIPGNYGFCGYHRR